MHASGGRGAIAKIPFSPTRHVAQTACDDNLDSYACVSF